LFDAKNDNDEIDEPLRGLTTDIDLKDADIEFSNKQFYKMFILHTLWNIFGPFLGLFMLIANGNNILANNCGFTLRGSNLFYKMF
jgi:hypothetical protein